jgi:tRNA(Ile)-lysidine synthase
MTDRKFSRTKKENQLLLCHGNDIVWLVNERVDNRFRVTDGCKRILHIKRNK